MAAPAGTALAFAPSEENGLRARRQVYDRLAESLEHIFESCPVAIDFDRLRADTLVSALRDNIRFPPSVFARYFDLLDVNERGDAAALTASLARLLDEKSIASERPTLRSFAGSGMSTDDTKMIARHFDLDEFGGAAILPLEPHDAQLATERFFAALELMRDTAPRTYAEVTTTVSEIIVAKGSTGENGYTFDGASSLQYWGAMIVNVANPKSLLETCETIAHEAAHNVLFGLSPRTFFVTNREDERYSSPLRDDPRPLDGIYHATFVLARMHFAVSEMLHSGRLERTEAEEAETLRRRSARYFADGVNVLEDHANFTQNGRAILSAAEAYMHSAVRNDVHFAPPSGALVNFSDQVTQA